MRKVDKMKKCVVAVYAVLVSATLLGKPFSSNKPYSEMTEEEKVIRRQEAKQNRLERLGGDIVKPDSQKGRIVYIDEQNIIGEEVFRAVVNAVTRQFKYRVDYVKGTGDDVTPMNAKRKLNELAANIAIFVVECDECDTMMLVAPESGWVIVNAKAVTKGAKNTAFAEGRMRKELMRAFYTGCGAANSKFEGSLMSAIASGDELDRLSENMSMDVVQRVHESLESRGVTPELKTFYRRACEQGWAPNPTNDIQRAIWDEYHTKPTEPMRIKFDPKKGM